MVDDVEREQLGMKNTAVCGDRVCRTNDGKSLLFLSHKIKFLADLRAVGRYLYRGERRRRRRRRWMMAHISSGIFSPGLIRVGWGSHFLGCRCPRKRQP